MESTQAEVSQKYIRFRVQSAANQSLISELDLKYHPGPELKMDKQSMTDILRPVNFLR